MKKIISVFMAVLLLSSVMCSCSKEVYNQELVITRDSHYSDLTDEAIDAYEALCRAVLEGEASISFDSALIDDVNKLFYISFPLSSLVESIIPDSSGRDFRIKYTQSTAKHLELVDEFKTCAFKIMHKCGYPDVSEKEYMLNLYTYISSEVRLDYAYSTAYDAIVNKHGSSAGYESAFQYLLQQAGIDASRTYAAAFDGVHFLTEVNVDGELYYFDPCAENIFSQGKGLSYFGLSISGLQLMGVGSDVMYSDNTAIPFNETSDKFSALFQTESYKYNNGVITANKGSGITVEIVW